MEDDLGGGSGIGSGSSDIASTDPRMHGSQSSSSLDDHSSAYGGGGAGGHFQTPDIGGILRVDSWIIFATVRCGLGALIMSAFSLNYVA